MLHIAIVEDMSNEAQRLESYIQRFSREKGEALRHTRYENADAFLREYHSQYDIVFMDIEMPGINGMDAARQLRERDPSVILIFVTHLSQYAVNGYEVDALDYIVKPVSYPAFALKLKRAVSRRMAAREDEIILSTSTGPLRLRASALKYVEIYKHHIVYYTELGEYKAYGVLKDVETVLPKERFFRVGGSYIVNLAHVTALSGMTVIVDSQEIPISRARKKELVAELNRYFSGRGPA